MEIFDFKNRSGVNVKRVKKFFISKAESRGRLFRSTVTGNMEKKTELTNNDYCASSNRIIRNT